MPTIQAEGKTITCESGANLRQTLIKNGVNLHNGKAKYINCRGIGSCGTCAVKIEGEVSQPNWKDKVRLSFPPHNSERDLRLACQTKVLGDLKITKYNGFWGQGEQKIWS